MKVPAWHRAVVKIKNCLLQAKCSSVRYCHKYAGSIHQRERYAQRKGGEGGMNREGLLLPRKLLA